MSNLKIPLQWSGSLPKANTKEHLELNETLQRCLKDLQRCAVRLHELAMDMNRPLLAGQILVAGSSSDLSKLHEFVIKCCVMTPEESAQWIQSQAADDHCQTRVITVSTGGTLPCDSDTIGPAIRMSI